MLQKLSGCEGVFDGLESLPNGRIVADVEYLAAIRLDHCADAIDKSVAQGLDSLKRSVRSAFSIGGAPLDGAGL